MTFEEAKDRMDLYSIDPSLTCTCDEHHCCQQCEEEEIENLKRHYNDDDWHLYI